MDGEPVGQRVEEAIATEALHLGGAREPRALAAGEKEAGARRYLRRLGQPFDDQRLFDRPGQVVCHPWLELPLGPESETFFPPPLCPLASSLGLRAPQLLEQRIDEHLIESRQIGHERRLYPSLATVRADPVEREGNCCAVGSQSRLRQYRQAENLARGLACRFGRQLCCRFARELACGHCCRFARELACGLCCRSACDLADRLAYGLACGLA